jgi:hypothetical protein
MQLLKRILTSAALTAALSLPFAAIAQTPAPAKDAKTATTKAAKTATAPPTAAEIADAKAKGLVWVNTNTKVYHTDGKYYGNTKAGKFMTVADAEKAGNRAAKESPIGKKKTPAATPPAKK